MAQIEIIDLGTIPNDGTGDVLRFGGQLINQNFAELNLKKLETGGFLGTAQDLDNRIAAIEADYATLSTAQTFTAVKNFDVLPTSNVTPTTAFQLVNKDYVDNLIANLPISLADLSDVSSATPSDKFVLIANGTDFESRALTEADISNFGPYDNYQSWNLKTNNTQRTTVQSNGDLDLVEGTDIDISYSAGGVVTFAFANNSGYITEAPSDGSVYGRENGTWVQISANAPNIEQVLIAGNDANGQTLVGLESISSNRGLFGSGVQNLRAFNVYGTGTNGRLNIQSNAGGNPGVEMTTTANVTRGLMRLAETGTDGAELEFWTEVDGGNISRHFVMGADGVFYIQPVGATLADPLNAGFRNAAGVMEYKDATGAFTPFNSLGATSLGDLTDVTDATPTDRNALIANGTTWESRAITEVDISDLGPYDNYQSWNLRTNGVQRTTIQSGGILDIQEGANIDVQYSAGGVVTIGFDNVAGYITDAPSDGNQYARQDGAWTEVTDPTIPWAKFTGQWNDNSAVLTLGDVDELGAGIPNLIKIGENNDIYVQAGQVGIGAEAQVNDFSALTYVNNGTLTGNQTYFPFLTISRHEPTASTNSLAYYGNTFLSDFANSGFWAFAYGMYNRLELEGTDGLFYARGLRNELEVDFRGAFTQNVLRLDNIWAETTFSDNGGSGTIEEFYGILNENRYQNANYNINFVYELGFKNTIEAGTIGDWRGININFNQTGGTVGVGSMIKMTNGGSTADNPANMFALNNTTGYKSYTNGLWSMDVDVSEITDNKHLITLEYFNANTSAGIPDAPADGNIYGRQDNNWVQTQGGLQAVVEDTAPQLGGNLDTQTFKLFTNETVMLFQVDADGGGAGSIAWRSGTKTLGQLDDNGPTGAALSVGLFNTTQGQITLHGNATNAGANFRMYNSVGEQTNTAFWNFRANDTLELSNDTEVIIRFQDNGILNNVGATIAEIDAGPNTTLTTKEWVLANGGGGIPDAPADGNIYGRQDNNWVQVTGGIPDAPADGQQYARIDNSWQVVSASVTWDQIQGDQSAINLIGFTDGVEGGSGGEERGFAASNTALKNFAFGQARNPNDGTIIAVANESSANQILTSTDNGVSYTVAQTTTTLGRLVTWLNDRFYMFRGGSGPVLSSIDNGVTWVDAGGAGTNKPINTDEAIYYPPNGRYFLSGSGVRYTTDFVTYSTSSGVFVGGSIASNGTDTIVNVGAGFIYTSTDGGDSFQLLGNLPPGEPFIVKYDPIGDRWGVVVNDGGLKLCIYNSDLSSFTITSAGQPVDTAQTFGAAFYSGRFFGYTRGVLYSTTDGNALVEEYDNGEPNNRYSFKMIVTPEGLLNYTGVFATSADNKDWLFADGETRKFENIVNEFQLNGQPIPIVDKTLNIVTEASKTKSFTVTDPINETLPLFVEKGAITIRELRVARAGANAVQFKIGYGTDLSSIDTDIIATTSVNTTGVNLIDSFSTENVPAGEFVFLNISDAGSATQFHITIAYE